MTAGVNVLLSMSSRDWVYAVAVYAEVEDVKSGQTSSQCGGSLVDLDSAATELRGI